MIGRLVIGGVTAAIAMFLLSFLFFASPLNRLAYGVAAPEANRAIQQTLSGNLPGTGTYIVPWPSDAAGMAAYEAGPVATIHFNAGGFPAMGAGTLTAGFIHILVAILLIGGGLYAVKDRLPLFVERARLVVLSAVGLALYARLGDPIWYHQDWRHAIYLFIADALILSAGGLILARWFLPARG